jgi:putative ABC transport system permease protein
MENTRSFMSRLFGSFRKNNLDSGLAEELDSHLEMLTQENIRAGMAPAEARRAARLKLGGNAQIKDAYRAQAGLPFLDVLLQDLRYGFRYLRKNRTFTLVAVITLALGIGANTAIFSVVNAVILRPLPYAHPQELITIKGGQSRPDLKDFGEQAKTIESIGGFWGYQFDLVGNGEPEQIQASLVSLGAFDVLGVPPLLGRTLSARDDVAGGAKIAVISEDFWRNRLGGDRAVIGKTLQLSGNTYEIVGVMPRSFWLPATSGMFGGGTQVFVPMCVGYPSTCDPRGLHALRAVARLRDGVSRAQAQTEIDSIAAQLAKLYPGENRDRHYQLLDLREYVVGDVRTTVLILFGAVGLVLLIASVNFANLLLAKASARQEETQIRVALGASPARLARQFLTESVLLALLGGIIGLVFAFLSLRLLVLLKPTDLPRLESVAIDGPVLLFSLALSFITGILFGMAPVLTAVRPRSDTNVRLSASSRSVVANRMRHGLIIVEFTVALVLLCAAGLLMRSLSRLQSVEPGFDPNRITTARIWLQSKKYEELPSQHQFYSQLEERLRQVPGNQGVGLVTELPMSGNRLPHNLLFNGRPPVPEGSEPDVLTNLVSSDYFKAMRIPVLAGRTFDASDRSGTPLVAVINAAMAKQYFPDEDPLGKQVTYARFPANERQWITIVGIVGNTKEWGAEMDDEAILYTPIQQNLQPWRRWSGIIVRGGDAPQAIAQIKQAVWSLDANIPVTKTLTMESLMSASLAQRKFTTLLLILFAATALALAMVGIYGVIAYSVVQRTREIGVRIALGAQRASVLWLVLRQALMLGVIGIAIGTLGSLYATRVLDSMIFGISARDPLTFATVAVTLLAVAAAAALVPAWRAAHIEPTQALRAE